MNKVNPEMSVAPKKIIVIGAGLIGLSCADSLARRGAQVTVFDMNDGPALGTSFSNSGMIHPSQAAPWTSTDLTQQKFETALQSVHTLAQHSKILIERRMKTLGLSDIGQSEGCYQIFKTQKMRDERAGFYEHHRIVCKKVDAELSTLSSPALFFSDDFSGNAYAYCAALEIDLKKRGVDFKYQTRVEKIAVEHGEFRSLHTRHGTQTSDHLVIACGLASQNILAQIGTQIDLYGERGFALDFTRPAGVKDMRPIMDADSRSALTVFEDRVRLSGTTGQKKSQCLVEIWEQIAPEFIARLGDPISEWSSDRPMSALGRPYIAPTATQNIWVNAGHGHMGWTLSAGSGDLMADMILKQTTDERFAVL